MATACLRIGFKFAIMCLLLWGISAQRQNQRKEELIQDTVRKFLGVKSDDRNSGPGKTHSLPPKYMMNLYEKYRSGQTPMQGNTVRSILAMKDKMDGVDMLIFNLTSLKSTEQILQSKIYLLKRKKPKDGKKKQVTFRLSVGCLPGMASKHEIEIALSRQKPEWHSYDISESVISCRQSRKGGESLLGLTLEIKRSKGSFRMVAFKRLVKPSSQPFVLIFSEDNQNQTTSTSTGKKQDIYGEIGDLLRAKANAEGILPENYRFPLSSGTKIQRGKRSFNNKVHFYQSVHSKYEYDSEHLDFNSDLLHAVVNSYNFSKNARHEFMDILRIFIDNIINSFTVNKHLHHFHQTKMIRGRNNSTNAVLTKKYHPTLTNEETLVLFSKTVQKHNRTNVTELSNTQTLTLQNRTKRALSDKLRYSTEVKESNTAETTVNTIQAIDENYSQNSSDKFNRGRPKHRRKKVHQSPRKHKKKRRRNRKLPFWWTKHSSRLHAQDMKLLCKRKSLMVDFSQLGWDDWIISPKSFNAHFCEGSCSFPIIKHTETSNHAAVQSLIHAMGINSNVPTPSCVPTTTSSLTLLYFDEYGGLVLKSYPNMIVEKCGCR